MRKIIFIIFMLSATLAHAEIKDSIYNRELVRAANAAQTGIVIVIGGNLLTSAMALGGSGTALPIAIVSTITNVTGIVLSLVAWSHVRKAGKKP